MSLLPFPTAKYCIDAPIGNNMIFEATMDSGYEDNVFDLLGGNVDDYAFLGYLRGYSPFINPHSVDLANLPRRVIWTAFSNPSDTCHICIGFYKCLRVILGHWCA